MEHHIFPVPNGVIDIVSDYGPKTIAKNKKEKNSIKSIIKTETAGESDRKKKR